MTQIEKVGSSRGWVRLSIDGRNATTPGEVITGKAGVQFVAYLASTRWDDDGTKPEPSILDAVRAFLESPNTLVE